MDNARKKLFAEIIAFATSPSPGPKPASLILRMVGRDEVELLKKTTGLVLKNYWHLVDPNGVRHAFKKHGLRPDLEEVPLRTEDLLRIPDIIDHPDSIERSVKTTGQGHMAIKYEKVIGEDVYFYVAEVVFGDMIIRTKTLYKNRLR